MITRVMKRKAVECSGCMKVHQIRLVNRQGATVTVVGGCDMKYPGIDPGVDTFKLAVAAVSRGTKNGGTRCPLAS